MKPPKAFNLSSVTAQKVAEPLRVSALQSHRETLSFDPAISRLRVMLIVGQASSNANSPRRCQLMPVITFEQVTALGNQLPDVAVSTSYGTPALKVRGKLMARLKEDGTTLVVRVSTEEQERVLTIWPDLYFLTDHYRGHPWVLINLERATIDHIELSLHHAWMQVAPKTLRNHRA